MREQYTANVIVPDDVRRRILPWLYMTSPKTLLPESEADTGPLIAFGQGLADSGEVEISVNHYPSDRCCGTCVSGLSVSQYVVGGDEFKRQDYLTGDVAPRWVEAFP